MARQARTDLPASLSDRLGPRCSVSEVRTVELHFAGLLSVFHHRGYGYLSRDGRGGSIKRRDEFFEQFDFGFAELGYAVSARDHVV